MRKPLKRLKKEHLKFCELVAVLTPPAVAYARAYAKSDNADKYPGNAARLLREPLIQAEIKQLLGDDEAANPAYIAYRRRLVRAELDRIAFFRLPDAMSARVDEWTDDQRAAIAEITVSEDGKRKIKAHSKSEALAQLIKLDGLAPESRFVAEARLEQAKEAQQAQEGGTVVTKFTLSIFDDGDRAAT